MPGPPGIEIATARAPIRQRHLLIFEEAALYGVVDIELFGSTARDSARPESDIDILVSFDGPTTSERYFGVQFYLEATLGRPVGLVTDKALRPKLGPSMPSSTGS